MRKIESAGIFLSNSHLATPDQKQIPSLTSPTQKENDVELVEKIETFDCTAPKCFFNARQNSRFLKQLMG